MCSPVNLFCPSLWNTGIYKSIRKEGDSEIDSNDRRYISYSLLLPIEGQVYSKKKLNFVIMTETRQGRPH